MKKIFAIALALAMILSLAACGEQETEQTVETTGTPAVETTVPAVQEETTEPQAQVQDEDPFSLTFEGVPLVPGTAYDAAVLPEPLSVYQVPSCAIEGTDNVYSFEALEITAFDNGTGEVIYSIVLVDPNAATDEGLMLGDTLEKVIELYGEAYEQVGNSLVYTRGGTTLTLILQGDYVVDIEFAWVAE